jgi:transposase
MAQEANRRKYSQDELELAIRKVETGDLTIYAASKRYAIPRSTIVNHVNGKCKGFKAGRPTLFSKEEEKVIVDLLLALSEWGYPLGKKQLIEIAHKFAKEFGITTANRREWTPGEDWLFRYN